jgi:hypothetical protein
MTPPAGAAPEDRPLHAQASELRLWLVAICGKYDAGADGVRGAQRDGLGLARLLGGNGQRLRPNVDATPRRTWRSSRSRLMSIRNAGDGKTIFAGQPRANASFERTTSAPRQGMKGDLPGQPADPQPPTERHSDAAKTASRRRPARQERARAAPRAGVGSRGDGFLRRRLDRRGTAPRARSEVARRADHQRPTRRCSSADRIAVRRIDRRPRLYARLHREWRWAGGLVAATSSRATATGSVPAPASTGPGRPHDPWRLHGRPVVADRARLRWRHRPFRAPPRDRCPL